MEEKIKNTQFQKESYDKIYLNSEKYMQHYKDVIYFPVWKHIMAALFKEDKILDLGCGPGHLANMLYDNKFETYVGIDFSKIAIIQAKIRAPLYTFIAADLFDIDYSVYADFKFVSVEVFEHLKDDISLIKALPKNDIIFSVPNYLCDNHYRTYNSEEQIKEYYYNVLDINKISKFSLVKNSASKIFVVEAKII